jgi:hypothetical protein
MRFPGVPRASDPAQSLAACRRHQRSSWLTNLGGGAAEGKVSAPANDAVTIRRDIP